MLTKTLSVLPRFALYILLIFTPLARGSVQGWAVSIIHLVTLIALTALLLNRCLNWKWKWIETPLDKPIFCLLVLCLLSSLFSMHLRSSIWSTVLLLNYVTFYYLVIHTIHTRTQLRLLIYLIIGVATFIAVFGLFKKFGANPFPWWDYADLKYSSDFLSATYGNHNHLAGYLEMVIPMSLGLYLTGFKGGKLFLMIYLTFVLLSALILSLSRGGWIGSLLGLSFMVIALLTSRHFQRKRLIIVLIGGFLALALIVLGSSPVVERVMTAREADEAANLSSRVTVWGGVVRMIKDHPLNGIGPGTFGTIFTRYQPAGLAARYFMAHNDYLHFISEVGLLLIPIMIWMIITLYRKGLKKIKNPSRLVRGTTLGAMSGITAILFHSIIDFNLHIPANVLLFIVLAAIVMAPLPLNRSSD